MKQAEEEEKKKRPICETMEGRRMAGTNVLCLSIGFTHNKKRTTGRGRRPGQLSGTEIMN